MPAPQAPPTQSAPGKGAVAKPPEPAAKAATGGVVVAGGGAAVHLGAGVPAWVAILAIVIILAVIGFFAWRAIAKHKAAQEAPTPGVAPVPILVTPAAHPS